MSFDSAVEFVLQREGGYVNNPKDRGGETKYGISKRSYPDLDIANLTPEQAKEIYRKDFWQAIDGDNIADPKAALVAFDAAVNHGPGYAKKLLGLGDAKAMIDARRKKYAAIIAKDPEQSAFERGWENRMVELEKAIGPASEAAIEPRPATVEAKPAVAEAKPAAADPRDIWNYGMPQAPAAGDVKAPELNRVEEAGVRTAIAVTGDSSIAADLTNVPGAAGEFVRRQAEQGEASMPVEGIGVAGFRAAAAADAKAAEKRGEVGLKEMWGASMRESPGWTIINRIARPEFEPTDEKLTPEDIKLLAGMDNAQDRADFLAAGSAAEREYTARQIAERKQREETLAVHGGAYGFIGGFGAVADPVAWVGAVGVARALAWRGIGSTVLAMQGRTAAAITSGVAENVAFETALEGVRQAITGRYDPGQALATAAFGAVFAAPGAAFDVRTSLKAQQASAAHKLMQDALIKEIELHDRAVSNLGDGATVDQIRKEMDRLQTEDLKGAVEGNLKPLDESRRFFPEPVDDAAEAGSGVWRSIEEAKEALGEAGVATVKAIDNWIGAQGRMLASRRKAFDDADSPQARSLMDRTGMTLRDIEALPQQVTYIRGFADGALLPNVQRAIDDLARQFFDADTRFVITDTASARTNAGTEATTGSLQTVGKVHIMHIQPGRPEAAQIRTAIHEMGHAILHQHAASIGPELLKRINKDYLRFLNDAKAGKREAVEARYSPISMNRKDDVPDLNEQPYFASLDEYTAEQFVKFIVDDIQKDWSEVALQPGVVNSIRRLVTKMIDFFLEAVNKGFLKPDESFADFFRQVMADNRLTRQADDAPSVEGIEVVWEDAPNASASGLAPRHGIIDADDMPTEAPPSAEVTKAAEDAWASHTSDEDFIDVDALMKEADATFGAVVDPYTGAIKAAPVSELQNMLDGTVLPNHFPAQTTGAFQLFAEAAQAVDLRLVGVAGEPRDMLIYAAWRDYATAEFDDTLASVVDRVVSDYETNKTAWLAVTGAEMEASKAFSDAYMKANPDATFSDAQAVWITTLAKSEKKAWVNHITSDMTKPPGMGGVPLTRAVRFDVMSPQFKAWFRNSVVKDKAGNPVVMFHGTGRDIRVFRAKQAGAIFISPDPKFAKSFSEMGEDYVLREAKTTNDLDAWEAVWDMARSGGRLVALPDYVIPDLKAWWAEHGLPNERSTLESMRNAAGALNDQRMLSRIGYLEEAINRSPEFKDALMMTLEARRNIMPLYVRAENPWDFQNPQHIADLEGELAGLIDGIPFTDEMLEKLGRDRTWEAGLQREVDEWMRGHGESLSDIMDQIRAGKWEIIEEGPIQRVIREVFQHDSFYMQEWGTKNLAVYSPSQVKSIFNIGEWDPDNFDISADMATDPVAVRNGLDLLPEGNPTEAADKAGLIHVWKKAEAWAAANPLDAAWEKRAQNLIDNSTFSVASTGLVMLKSRNPVVRMAAAELLEDASGVAGKRQSTAAISKYIHERMFMGNAVNDLQNAYAIWGKDKGGTLKSDLMGGEMWAQFNREVAMEIEARRASDRPTSAHPQVKQAADMLEAAYERMRKSQIESRTLGWGGLPETSRGYMPHKLSPRKVLNMTREQTDALHAALMDQFIQIEDMDISFAANLAGRYIERVRDRATGGFDSDVNVQSHGAQAILEDAMRAMDLTPAQIKAQLKKFARGAAAHTKGRLNLDLNRDYNGFKLVDLFETDQLQLLRSQAQRVSGEVALARFGIYGKPGLAQLRKAMQYGDDASKATMRELEAFDQVASEFLGQPFGKAEGKWMERARTLNSVTRLGGLVFNQFGEFINGIFHVGLGRTLAGVGGMARLRREILALARGERVDNPLLGSIEAWGAQFGTDSYKLVFPFDHPDHAYATYGRDGITAFDRVLRGASHAQSKLSMWRAMHAVQERGMAEQIIAKLGHYVRNGGEDVALGQMGFTPDIVAALRNSGAFEWRGTKLVGFDVTKIADLDVAEQVVHAVHRGVKQIIQGTFIGEQGKWAHDGVLKLMLQFRTFGVTAAEKQWGRQRNSRGMATALGMLVMSMGVAAPIYMTRVYLASIGRDDQEEYLERRLSTAAITRATLNYVASAGLLGDVIDALSAPMPDTVKEVIGEPTGGRSGGNTTVIGNLVAPSLGYVDDVFGVLKNLDDPEKVARVLPFSRLPYLLPAINALGEE